MIEEGKAVETAPDGITEFLPLVRYVVGKLMPRQGQLFEREDLVQCGVVGLMEARKRYRPELGTFPSFAIPRIRGAILDALRANDFISRITRQDMRTIEAAEGSLIAFDGSVTTKAVHAKSELTENRFRNAQQATRLSFVPIDGDGSGHPGGRSLAEELPDAEAGALAGIVSKESTDELRFFVERLPERERTIISLHFVEALTMREIAAVLAISESRVSQLQARALGRLRESLKHVA